MVVRTIMFGRNTDAEVDVIIIDNITGDGNHELYEFYAQASRDSRLWKTDEFERDINQGFVEIYDISMVNVPDMDDIIQYGNELIDHYTGPITEIDEYLYTQFAGRWFSFTDLATPPGELLYNIMTRQ